MTKTAGGNTKCNTTCDVNGNCKHRSYRKGHGMISFRAKAGDVEEFNKRFPKKMRSMILRRLLTASLSDYNWLQLQEVELEQQLLAIRAASERLKLKQQEREIKLRRGDYDEVDV